MNNLFTKESLGRLTESLIRYKTVHGNPEEFAKCFDYIKQYFLDTKVLINEYEQNGDKSLVILNSENKNPQVFMVGHIDVVDAKENQFTPFYRDGRLYGRGACDMKSGVAVLMQLMRHFAALGSDKIGLILTSDEERGGANGVDYLLNKLNYRSMLAIIPDGGNAPDQVIVKNKGFLRLELSVKGKSAHASRPWEGRNAIHALITALNGIKTQYPDVDDSWVDTVNIGLINGGKAANQVADEAQAVLDIRFTENKSAEEMTESIKNSAKECDVRILLQGDIGYTDPGDDYLKTFAKILKDETGTEVKFLATPGGNDGRYFSKLKIPVLVNRPISEGLHGPDEWVDLASLESYAKVYLKFLTQALM